MAEQFDVNAEVQRRGYNVYDISYRSEENPQDREHRQRLELQDQIHRHRVEWLDARAQQGKSALLFIFALGGISIVLWYCLETVLASTIAEEKKWALSGLTSIVSVLVGFVTGRALK